MKSNLELSEVVKENKKIGYFKLKACVAEFAKAEMRALGYREPMYKLKCNIKNYRGYDADVMGDQCPIKDKTVQININSSLVDALQVPGYEGNNRVDLFFYLYHELTHVWQNTVYQNPQLQKGNEDLIKDQTICTYFKRDKSNPYYWLNYKVITSEVQANLKGVELTINYFRENGISLTQEEQEKLIQKYQEQHQLSEIKTRINPFDNQTYLLDDLYSMILMDKTFSNPYPVVGFTTSSVKRSTL